jgi:hypothetical protein
MDPFTAPDTAFGFADPGFGAPLYRAPSGAHGASAIAQGGAAQAVNEFKEPRPVPHALRSTSQDHLMMDDDATSAFAAPAAPAGEDSFPRGFADNFDLNFALFATERDHDLDGNSLGSDSLTDATGSPRQMGFMLDEDALADKAGFFAPLNDQARVGRLPALPAPLVAEYAGVAMVAAGNDGAFQGVVVEAPPAAPVAPAQAAAIRSPPAAARPLRAAAAAARAVAAAASPPQPADRANRRGPGRPPKHDFPCIDGRFYCPAKCGAHYNRRTSVERHLLKEHPNEADYLLNRH